MKPATRKLILWMLPVVGLAAIVYGAVALLCHLLAIGHDLANGLSVGAMVFVLMSGQALIRYRLSFRD